MGVRVCVRVSVFHVGGVAADLRTHAHRNQFVYIAQHRHSQAHM